MKRTDLRSLTGFVLVVIVLLFPFNFDLFALHTHFVRALFSPCALSVANICGYSPLLSDLSSDSIGLYFHLLSSAISALILYLLLSKIYPRGLQFRAFQENALSWFLVVVLFKYGFDKLFLRQFPVPEGNLLYTPLGHLDKDILFWTSMASSTLYNVLTGSLEVITAVLILIRKTRSVGVIIAFGIFLQVLIINLSFDISVKLFSGLLLTISVFLASPSIRRIWLLLVHQKSIHLPTEEFQAATSPLTVRVLLILTVLSEALHPYLPLSSSSEFPLQGTYNCTADHGLNIKRIFIHSDGYLILQNKQDELSDYKAEVNTLIKKIRLTDYDGTTTEITYSRDASDGALRLSLNGEKPPVQFQKAELKDMPLLKDGFHWSVD